MITTIAAAILASVLSFGDVPPNTQLPVELEVCILKAELCAEDAAPMLGMCIGINEPALEQCIEDYEDCSYAFPEAHEPSCRLDHVWCALEAPFSIVLGLNDDLIKHCLMVDEVCPSF